MLGALKQNRSLTFYNPQQSSLTSRTSTATQGLTSVHSSYTASQVGSIITSYNKECANFIRELGAERVRLNTKVSEGLANDPNYTGARNDGVSLAWDYEAADIKMGGQGSGKWNVAEQQEILENRPDVVNKPKTVDGKTVNPKAGVRGAEGHHQKNVADHPDQQANPDNIKFYKDRQSHLNEGHGGDFHNETDADFIDKDAMLNKTNQKRVIKKELSGLKAAVAIGLGIGFTLTFIAELAQTGISAEGIQNAVIAGAASGFESAAIAAAGYGIGLVSTNILTKAGIDVISVSGKLLNTAVTGLLTVVIVSVYQFVKMKLNGYSTGSALRQIGKQAAFSLSLLAVSITVDIIAKGSLGGHAGLIVSTAIGLIYFSYSAVMSVKERHTEAKLREYTIQQYKPLLLQ